MESRKFIIRECGVLALGQLVCVGLIVAAFALLGRFDWDVVIGGVVGAVLSIANFFVMGVSADVAADRAVEQDVKGGQAVIKTSFYGRMIGIVAVLFIFAKSGLCNLIAMVLPLFVASPILMVTEYFRKSGGAKS